MICWYQRESVPGIPVEIENNAQKRHAHVYILQYITETPINGS